MKIFFALLLCFFSMLLLGQEKHNLSNLIQQKLDSFSSSNYQEKVFIHTDKNDYQTGDIIWFTAYMLNASSHKKSNKSFVLYAELINSKDSILYKHKLYMKDISTPSDFTIPKKVKPGKYTIRAYTNYMLNDGHDSFFTKKINIWSKTLDEEAISIPTTINAFDPDLHFFPEGGYLIHNIKSMVAIKLKNPVFDTLPIKVKIIDNLKRNITSITTNKFGLGKFFITPEINKTYKAIVNFDGKEYSYQLPITLELGESLAAIQTNKDLFVTLKSNKKNGLQGATVAIHQRGNAIYTKTIVENTKTKTLKLPLTSIPSGVVHITLFNSNHKPTAERLVYINNTENNINVSIKKPKAYYVNKRKVDLQIQINDKTNQDLKSVFSLTVKDLRDEDDQLKENIKTWLLLNSDIKGKIKNPNYFFKDNTDRKRKYLLDLVMMTHGWRRFKWQNLLQKSSFKKEYDVEKGFIISGRTYDMRKNNSPIPAQTRLTFLGKTIEQEPTRKANKLGEFSYGPFVYFDSLPAVIEARKTSFKSKRNRERKVLIIRNNKKPSPKIYKDTLKHYSDTQATKELEAYKKFLSNFEDLFRQSDYVLDEVTIKGELKDDFEKRKDAMSKRTSYGDAFNRYDIENQPATRATALDLFYTVPRINVIRDSLYVKNVPNNIPLILYDEMPIDVLDLQNIDAGEVSFIDVLIGEEASMFTSGGAVISMYSKLGNGSGLNSTIYRKPGIIDFKAVGFYTGKEYYPSDPNDLEMQFKSDQRTTLHWEPKIEKNSKAPIEVSFYTSDYDSKYVIEIQGITRSGKPFYKTDFITVE